MIFILVQTALLNDNYFFFFVHWLTKCVISLFAYPEFSKFSFKISGLPEKTVITVREKNRKNKNKNKKINKKKNPNIHTITLTQSVSCFAKIRFQDFVKISCRILFWMRLQLNIKKTPSNATAIVSS